MWGFSDICVYDWSGWKGTLIETISPRARRIRARFAESPERLANRLPRRARLLILHLDITDNAPFIADAAQLGRLVSQRGVAVLNGLAGDIRKTTVQACCKAYGLPSVTAAAEGLSLIHIFYCDPHGPWLRSKRVHQHRVMRQYFVRVHAQIHKLFGLELAVERKSLSVDAPLSVSRVPRTDTTF